MADKCMRPGRSISAGNPAESARVAVAGEKLLPVMKRCVFKLMLFQKAREKKQASANTPIGICQIA